MNNPDQIAERLSVRINDTLSTHPVPSPRLIGQMGAVLFGHEDEDVAALRGESTAVLSKAELPDLIATALRLLNDPRILDISSDGDNKSGEVMIDVVMDNNLGVPTTFIIRSNDIDEETTGLDRE